MKAPPMKAAKMPAMKAAKMPAMKAAPAMGKMGGNAPKANPFKMGSSSKKLAGGNSGGGMPSF